MKKAPLVIISLLILVCLSGCGKKTVTEPLMWRLDQRIYL